VKLSIPYIDAQAELDGNYILNQVAWFKTQNAEGYRRREQIIDKRYAILLPQR
jgi:hypothetical protein